MTDHHVSFNLSECIKILEFITNIPKNHKPCYNSMTTISKDAWFTTVRRRWGGEKGEYGIIYISKILDSCDHHYRMCLQSSLSCENKTEGIETLKRLKEVLLGSINGFDNLIDTYSDQTNVSNDYKQIKSRIDFMINGITHDIKQIGTIYDRPNTPEDGNEYENSTLNYILPGWGYLSDECNSTDTDKTIETKNIVITSLDSTVTSKNPKFFVGNNIILMKTKPTSYKK